MNILPPMMIVWHHCVQKHLGDAVDVVIFDCSGKLHAEEFPGARVQKFLNFYAATKSDEFLRHIAKHRRIGWICDDDVFPISGDMLPILQREFQVEKTASVSFKPRTWWHFDIDGTSAAPSGSYCIAFDRRIFVEEEGLSLAPMDGNPHPADVGRPPGRYDTADKANEILLRKGYRCAIVEREERERCVAAFSGMSGAVMLLSSFRRPEQVVSYYQSPEKKQWGGNVLYGTLASMLAICTIQECYEQLRGKRYPLPSLPSRKELEKIRHEHEPYLRSDQSFAWVDEQGDKLKQAL